MEDYTSYLIAWSVYGVVALLMYILLWIGIRYIPARNLRWFLRMAIAAVLIVPWRGEDPEVYFAPAIIVGAFAFMDTGLSAALAELELLLAVLLVLAVITLVKELMEFGWRWRRRMNEADPEPQQEARTMRAQEHNNNGV